MVNWIKAGLLHAQRTAGGQYRILFDDLHAFMRARGMSTALLDEETGDRPLCWEFHSGVDVGEGDPSVCDGCLVKSLGVLHCFKLMGMRPGPGHRHESCDACDYFRRWGDALEEAQPIQEMGRGR
jgi:hypothetical protein